MVNHHGLVAVRQLWSEKSAVVVIPKCFSSFVCTTRLSSDHMGTADRSPDIERSTFSLNCSRLNTLAAGMVRVASKEHRHSENVCVKWGGTWRLVLYAKCAYMHAHGTVYMCICVVFECIWLLRLSSVRALKVGPDFTVISHPNGSCHILLPTHGWRTTKSQEEKRKLYRHSICLSLSLSEQKPLYS